MFQRKVWREKYNITETQLHELFSEFTSMVMIARQIKIETHPQSMQSLYKRTAEAKDYLGDLLPFSGSVRKWQSMKKEQT